MFMDFNLFELGADERRLRDEAASLCAAISDMSAEADAMSTIHPGVREALRESGLARLMVPAEFGGRFESVDPLAVCVVREVMMKESSH